MPGDTKQIIVDVRTADPCTAENVKRSAQVPGTPLAELKSLRKINGRITSTPKATFSLVLLSKQGGLLVMVLDHYST